LLALALLLNFSALPVHCLALDRNSVLVVPFVDAEGHTSDVTQELTELALKNIAMSAEGVRIFTFNKEVVTRPLSKSEILHLARLKGVATVLLAQIIRLDRDPNGARKPLPGSQFLGIHFKYELIEAVTEKTLYSASRQFTSIRLQALDNDESKASEVSSSDSRYVLEHVMQRTARKIARDLVRHYFSLNQHSPEISNSSFLFIGPMPSRIQHTKSRGSLDTHR
jgi:hypothetical protein